jgi:3-deoxy-7-phosphoheptulonate synthase
MSSNLKKQAKDIFDKKDDRKVLIVGPCSIHDKASTLEYAKLLKEVMEETKDKLFIIMRAFIEKPRTGSDWKGFLSDPNVEGSDNLTLGLQEGLELFEQLKELNIPLATEFIDYNLAPLFSRFITWGFIGARTTRSPIHRTLSSYLDLPIGFKNPLDGDISAALAACDVAKNSHEILIPDANFSLKIEKTKGNPRAHTVLRGSSFGSNHQEARLLRYPLIIDCAHGNSQKNIQKMEECFDESLEMMLEYNHILGLMFESHLYEGCQNSSAKPLKYGVSITDPCVGFEKTKQMIYKAYSALQTSSSVI